MKNDKELFMDVVFEMWKDSEHFDSVIFRMSKCYDIFYKNVRSFSKFSIVTKYQICNSAMLIAVQSMTNQIQGVSIFKREIEFLEYSLFFREDDKSKVYEISNLRLLPYENTCSKLSS